MFPFPHYFGLDFSSALPWILTGFVFGVLLSGLWRWLKGRSANARAEVRVNEIQALLAVQKNEHQADVSRLLSDARSFEIALADAERRAAQAGGKSVEIKSEMERLAQAELASRNDLLAMDNELGRLRSNLQWAESQAKSLMQDRLTFEQQLRDAARTRQAVAADLATARTAADLKDSEIARLINQVQWHESRASGFSAVQSGAGAKDAEIVNLQADLAAAKAALVSLETERAGHAQALVGVPGGDGWIAKDRDYTRNLAYWQASEIDRLRALVTKYEGATAASRQAFGALQLQHATLKSRLATRQGALGAKALGSKTPGAKSRLAYFRRQGTNATSSDSHAHAKGAAPGIAVHLRREGPANALARAKGSKFAKAFAGSVRGRGGAGGEVIALGAANRFQTRRANPDELAALQAKVNALSEDAANYRRLRQALDVANRIASGNGG